MWYQVCGSSYLVPITWSPGPPVLGVKHSSQSSRDQVCGLKYMAQGAWFQAQVPSTRFQVLDTKSMVSSTWSQASSIQYLVPSIFVNSCYQAWYQALDLAEPGGRPPAERPWGRGPGGGTLLLRSLQGWLAARRRVRSGRGLGGCLQRDMISILMR